MSQKITNMRLLYFHLVFSIIFAQLYMFYVNILKLSIILFLPMKQIVSTAETNCFKVRKLLETLFTRKIAVNKIRKSPIIYV